MRVHHHPRNLRRSVGSQPVVCVGRPSWSEAGIAALVIPAQSSRWTSRGQGDVHCRRADVPTCRRADVPTCRRADVVVDDRRDSGPLNLFRPQLRRFLHLQQQRRRICPNPTLQTTPALPRLSNCPKVCFSFIAPHHPPPVKHPSHWEPRGTCLCLVVSN
jgi:hypothetical protein